MLSVVARKRRLCEAVLAATDAVVGFADVGAGGPLKRPWSLLPANRVRTFDFEPTAGPGGTLPQCVSNREGEASLYIARDERASSLHRPVAQFAERFGMPSLFQTHTITVSCVTLDRYFTNRFESVDALDVNVEGHDLQVLQGGRRLLEEGGLKLLKVEFELTAVWEGQGWLSDIDPLLRGHGYELAGIDIESARPVSVRHYFHRGEPLWGKALYVPGAGRWRGMLERVRPHRAAMAQAAAKGIALYIAADMPGRALDVLQLCPQGVGRVGMDAAAIRLGIDRVYRFARLERGARELWRLAARAVGARYSEA